MKDVIIKVLDREFKTMDSDPNLRESRKYHVLKSIIQENEKTGKDEKIKELLKEILNKDGSFNGAKRRQLNELGFIVNDGKHYKIIFGDDDRYMFTLSKTTGDYRSNLNAVSKAANKLFGHN